MVLGTAGLVRAGVVDALAGLAIGGFRPRGVARGGLRGLEHPL